MAPFQHVARGAACAAALALLIATLIQAPVVASKVDVFGLLDQGKVDEVNKVSTKKLLRTLRKGRRYAKAKVGQTKREFTDDFGRTTQLTVIIPKKPTGLLFLLHGLGGNGGQLIPSFRSFAASNGLIIVAPDAKKEPTSAQNEDSTDTTRGFQHWWSYRDKGFVLSALRKLKREFAIDENRVYLSGYSMGGFGSWNLGLRYADRFAAIAPMAGGISGHEYVKEKHEEIRKLLLNALHLPSYILHGDADRTVPVRFDRRTRDDLTRLGYEHEYVEVAGGGHVLDISPGKPLLKNMVDWLSKKQRRPHPKEVKFHSLGSYMPQLYWIRIDKFAGKGPAEVTARIGAGNKIEVTTTGVAGLTVFLDDKLIKLKKSVQIHVNGKLVHESKVKMSQQAMIESWLAREDRQLVYPAMVTIEL